MTGQLALQVGMMVSVTNNTYHRNVGINIQIGDKGQITDVIRITKNILIYYVKFPSHDKEFAFSEDKLKFAGRILNY